MNIFFSFIGGNDRNCILGKKTNLGPIGTILMKNGALFDEVVLLLDPSIQYRDGINCLNKISPFYKAYYQKKLTVIPLPEITNPSDHQQIYHCLHSVLADYTTRTPNIKPNFHFNLSSGTPAMHAILLLFGKASYQALMYQSYEKDGDELIDEVTIPFPITLEAISREIKEEASIVHEVLHQESEYHKIIGNHPTIVGAKSNTLKYALCDFNMLITGESGTGKELFARYYQQNNPARNKATFVCENCANFPETLIESELFGHVKGAFTGADRNKSGSFERADKGVLFLDEIGEMPDYLQAKLLRVLETGMIRPVGSDKYINVDVRIVAATNRPDKLRPDLHYRLADGIIDLPPLRNRGEDIIAIAESVLNNTNKFLGTKLLGIAPYYYKSFDDSARIFLLTNSWMGNVRELISVIRRACALESEQELSAAILQRHLLGYTSNQKPRLCLPFDPQSEIIINQPINLMQELKQIKKQVLNSKRDTFRTKQQMAEFFGFAGISALNRHL